MPFQRRPLLQKSHFSQPCSHKEQVRIPLFKQVLQYSYPVPLQKTQASSSSSYSSHETNKKRHSIKNNLTNLTSPFLHQMGQDKKSPLYPLFPTRKSRVCVYPSTAHVMHCVQDAQPRTVHAMAHSPHR